MDRYKEAPHWEADRAYFALATYKAGVEAAQKAASKWPTPEQVAQAMPGLEVESLGGKGRFRKDKIAEQVFYQGPSTNTNKYDFPTLASIDTFQAEQLQKPPGADFWQWIKSAKMPI
jgi:branched-chain amino acid transport system substrate-binding protein